MAKYDLQPNMQVDIAEDLSPIVKKLSENTEVPLFSKLGLMRGTGSVGAKAREHEWFDDLEPSQITKLQTTINNSTTTVVLDLYYNGIPVKVLKDQEFEIETSDGSDKEVFKVTADPVVDTGAKTITCTVTTRGYKSTTAAAADAGVRIELLAPTPGFGARADANDNTTSQRLGNYVQMYRGTVGVTNLSELLDSHAKDGRIAEQKERMTDRQMKRLHRNTIRGKKFRGNNSDLNEFQTHAGIDEFIENANTASGNDFNKIDGQGNPVSLGLINDFARRAREVNHKITSIVCSHRMKQAINEIKGVKTTGAVMQSERSLNDIVDYIDSESGLLEIVPTTDVADNIIYAFNKEDVEVVPVQGGQFRSYELGVTGSSKEVVVEGYYTVVCHLPQAMFKVFDVALS